MKIAEECLNRLVKVVKSKEEEMIGITPAYNCYFFNEGSFFERYQFMPVTFKKELLYNEDGRRQIVRKFINAQEYFYGFHLETRIYGNDDFLCSVLLPDYGIKLENVDKMEVDDELKEALDYFSTFDYFNVRMALDVSYAFVHEVDTYDSMELVTASNLLWRDRESIVEVYRQVGSEDMKTVFDFMLEAYNKNVWRRCD